MARGRRPDPPPNGEMSGAGRRADGDARGRPGGPRPGSRPRRDPALPSGAGSGPPPKPEAVRPGQVPLGQVPLCHVPPGHVLVGEFGRAHGLSGEVRLKSYTGDPLAIARYGPLAGAGGRRFVLSHLRRAAGDQPDLLVARVAGVATRAAAEALNRLGLHVPRERLPPPEDEDEFLLADLVGLDAVAPDGAPAGRIVAVPNYGGGDLLEILPAARGPTMLVPFTKAFVPQIDIAAGRVVVDLPPEDAEADGLEAPHGREAP